MSRREGNEAELVSRLTDGIRPEGMRRALMRCLSGEVSPPVTLMELLRESENVTTVRYVVDDITQRADADSRASDSLVRDRVDELTRLLVENESAYARVAERMRESLESSAPAPTVEDGLAFWGRLFDWAVRENEEASVALYSLGSPELLDRGTEEVVDLFERWGLLAPTRRILQIGCGTGRLERALAPRVLEAHGVDVSGEMVRVAERRCAGLPNVHLRKTDGRDLSMFRDGAFDLVYSVDTFPFLRHAGPGLVESHVREAHRVLKPGGDLVILGYSQRGAPDADRAEVRQLAAAAGFTVLVDGTQPFTVWDGAAFRLRKD
jgi:SAM-dependent methyltransferase